MLSIWYSCGCILTTRNTVGITMYNLTGVAAIGIPLLLSSINNVTLFFSFFSAILLVAGLATQFILLWPKLSGIWVLETEFDGPKMAPLSSFTVSSSRSTSIRVNRQAKMVAAAMSMSSMTVQLERHTWETMTIVAHTRIVTGKLSELMALWSKSTVMYFRDLETRLPMLGILSSTQAPGVGQFLDLSLALFKLYSIVPVTASTNGGKGMVERSMSKTGKTSSFLNPEVAQPGAYSVIQIKMTVRTFFFCCRS
ncbi:hypothetical protein BC828DRAFT_259008 [Blastocladiella britannica]|nr:hypothetical protein BC828DRAFT_259008 [Blastocladiella britannica]